MSDDVMLEIIKRSTEDEAFRQRLVSDLDGTLQAEGYQLSKEELAAAREFHGQYAEMDDDQLRDTLDKNRLAGAV